MAKLAKTGERAWRRNGQVARLDDEGERGIAKPVFVGLNAGLDWSFVNWYFIHFTGGNPFGFARSSIKSYYMGLIGCGWGDTKSSRMRPEFQPSKPGDHNALTDARAQAEMFEKMRAAERRLTEALTMIPTGYDPISLNHWLWFKYQCHECSPADFQRTPSRTSSSGSGRSSSLIKPYGNIGDRKCDGLFHAEGVVFQVYSPDDLKQDQS